MIPKTPANVRELTTFEQVGLGVVVTFRANVSESAAGQDQVKTKSGSSHPVSHPASYRASGSHSARTR